MKEKIGFEKMLVRTKKGTGMLNEKCTMKKM